MYCFLAQDAFNNSHGKKNMPVVASECLNLGIINRPLGSVLLEELCQKNMETKADKIYFQGAKFGNIPLWWTLDMTVFFTRVIYAELTSDTMSSTSHYLPTGGLSALPHLSHVSFVSRYILSDVNASS